MNRPHTIEIRVPAHLASQLRDGVAHGISRESVVFALVRHARLKAKTLLLVRKIISLPDDAYIPTRGHGAKWKGSAMLPILNVAMAEDLGIVPFHSHPHAGQVSLSADDRDSAAQLLPVFQNLVPSRPHGSVVLGKDHAGGVVVMPRSDTPVEALGVRWLGKIIVDFPGEEGGTPVSERNESHHRQALLTGSAGEARLRRTKVAVVGLSGGGSHIVQQLALLGVGEIIGIDPDRSDVSNRSRLIGMTKEDARRRRLKIKIMKRMVRQIDGGITFTGVPHAIPEKPAIDALREADIVVGCVDSYHARADLQELSWRYLIPYVDIGLLIQPLQAGVGVTIGGNVITAIPGEFCQWCIGFLSDEKLAAETGGRPRSYFQGTDKQAQVVSMNGVLASQAVNEILKLVTGFAPTDHEESFTKFDGLQGTLEKWRVKRNSECRMCHDFMGSGDPTWRLS